MEDELKEEPRAIDMELRDYFAAKVLAEACKKTTNTWAAARMSYEYADAMIEVREEKNK
jgi:hypothetical protein